LAGGVALGGHVSGNQQPGDDDQNGYQGAKASEDGGATKQPGSALEHVAETVDLHSYLSEPLDRLLDGTGCPVELAYDPAHVVLDIGPSDVGQDVEALDQLSDDRLLDQVLREGQADANLS
jgi:hypothetical protein